MALGHGAWQLCFLPLAQSLPAHTPVCFSGSDAVVPLILMDFSFAPTGAHPENAAGPHCAGCPRAVLRKATLSALAAQRAQLLWHEPGECVLVSAVLSPPELALVGASVAVGLQLEE